MSVWRAPLGVRVAVRVGSPSMHRTPCGAAEFSASQPLTDGPSPSASSSFLLVLPSSVSSRRSFGGAL